MSKAEKVSTLQVMRGIAIILVLVWHSISQVNRNPVLNGLGQIIICFHIYISFSCLRARKKLQKAITEKAKAGTM